MEFKFIDQLPLDKLNSLSVNKKLILLVGVPMLVLLLFVGNDIITKVHQQIMVSQSNAKIQELSQMANTISAYVHESQKERGITAGFIGSGGRKFKDKVANQRKSTNAKLQNLQEFLNTFNQEKYPSLKQDLKALIANTKQLTTNRKKIDNLSFTLAQELGYYSTMNANALKVIGAMSQYVSNPNINRQVASYESFLQAKERAGIERGLMNGVLASGQFKNSGQFVKFITLVALQDSYLSQFKRLASDEQKAFFTDTMAAPAVSTVEEMRHQIRSLGTGQALGIPASTWFQQQTKRINLLKKVEDRLANDLVEASQKLQSASGSELLFSGFVGLVAILALGLAFIVARGITRPLQQLSQAIHNVQTTGQFKAELDIHGKDEVGQAIEAFSQLLQKLDQAFSDINQVMANASDGDLSKQVDENANGDLLQLQKNVNKTLSDLSETLSEVRHFAHTVSVSMEELSANSSNIKETGLQLVQERKGKKGCVLELKEAADGILTNVDSVSNQTNSMVTAINSSTSRVNEINEHVQTVASAIEEMSASFTQVSDSAQSCAVSNKQVFKMAENTQQAVSSLSQAAQEIGKVTEMIKSIASQTNLLALNATIEAASAGEAGKGFAVVANEVKELAKQSGDASEDIQQRIDDIQSNTANVLSAMEQITLMMQESSNMTNNIATSVQEQTLVNNEISVNVSQLAQAAQTVSETMHETNDMANHVVQAVQTTQGQTNVIHQSVGSVNDSVQSTVNGLEESNLATNELAKLTGELNIMLERFQVSSGIKQNLNDKNQMGPSANQLEKIALEKNTPSQKVS